MTRAIFGSRIPSMKKSDVSLIILEGYRKSSGSDPMPPRFVRNVAVVASGTAGAQAIVTRPGYLSLHIASGPDEMGRPQCTEREYTGQEFHRASTKCELRGFKLTDWVRPR